MRVLSTAFVACALFAFGMMQAAPAEAAGTYKCKGKTSFGQMQFTFKKGRVRGGGYTLQSKILDDGTIRLSYQGESAFFYKDGSVRGHDGAKTGNHSCDVNAASAALKK